MLVVLSDAAHAMASPMTLYLSGRPSARSLQYPPIATCLCPESRNVFIAASKTYLMTSVAGNGCLGARIAPVPLVGGVQNTN